MSKATRTRKAVRPIGPSVAYIPLTQGYFALIDSSDADWLEQWNWVAAVSKRTSVVYAYRSHCKPGGGTTSKKMHREIFLPDRNFTVDHISGDGIDNRRVNMRAATMSEQNVNKPMSRLNKSGFKGVSWHKLMKKWEACVSVKGKNLHLGHFSTPEEAYTRYKAKSEELYGQFAVSR